MVSGAGSGNVTTTNTGWKAIVPISGKYQINLQLVSAAGGGWAAGEEWTGYIKIDGTTKANFITVQTATHSQTIRSNGAVTLNLLAGQRIEGWLYQTSGAALNIIAGVINNYIEITRVGNY